MSKPEERLLLAIFRPRREKVLQNVTTWFYERSETGVFGWLGDRTSDLQDVSYKLRCWRKGVL